MNRNLIRRSVFLWAGLLFVPGLTMAQAYPLRPVKIVVPQPAGGYYDLIARTIGQKLAERLGQPMVVENRAGAAGVAGTAQIAKAAPDGYTISVNGIGPLSIAPALHAKLAYDPMRDFAPVIHVSSLPNIVVVHSSVAAQNMAELAGLARAKPGELNYASNGNGTSQHLSAVLFEQAAGVRMNHIPFNGSAPAITAMLGAQTALLFGVSGDVLPHVRAGKLRALAVTGTKRIAALPDVPTMHEAGVANYASLAWMGFLAPAGTPREIVERLNAEIGRTLDYPDVRERLSPGGLAELPGGTPEQFGRFIQAEIAKWAGVVKAAGVKVE